MRASWRSCAAAQLAVGHGHAQHRRVALHVPAVLQAQRAELVVAAARRPGGARSWSRNCAARARTNWRSKSVYWYMVKWITFRPAVTSDTHSSVRTSRSGRRRGQLRAEPDAGQRADQQRRQQLPVDVAQRSRGRCRPPASAAPRARCRCRPGAARGSRGYSSRISVAPIAPAPIEVSDTSTPRATPLSTRQPCACGARAASAPASSPTRATPGGRPPSLPSAAARCPATKVSAASAQPW